MIPDNRLRFPSSLIDFTVDVGLSGQDHESFPAPGAQPRWDWFLIYFIGLLANQSSYDEPTQYRDGSLWFDLNNLTLKVYRNGAWAGLAESIELQTVAGTLTTLHSWYSLVNSQLSGAAPEATFSGYCITDGKTEIPVPVTIQGAIDMVRTRPFVYINGLLVDPRSVEYFTATTVALKNDIVLNDGDRFTVVIKNITSTMFSVPEVVVS